LPRFTGEVRVGFEVIVRKFPCAKTPPRGVPETLTRRNSSFPFGSGKAVVRRQRLVDEGVVRVEELQNAPVAGKNVLKYHLRFATHRLAKFRVEGAELVRVRRNHPQPPRFQPLPGKIPDERISLGVLEHPLDLRRQHHSVEEFALFRKRKKLGVGHSAPKKIGQAVGQLVRRDRVDILGVGRRRVQFDAE
jgi:hypothetical protein